MAAKCRARIGRVDGRQQAAGGVLTAKQAPHRPGTAPALGLRAGCVVATIIEQTITAEEILMWFRTLFDAMKQRRSGNTARRTPRPPPTSRLRLEALEDRTVLSAPSLGLQGAYVQTNLVSDIPGLALLTDANLKNPWGTSFSADGSFSISNQNTSVSTLYAVHESGVSAASPTVAIPTIPTIPAAAQGPTGQTSNDTSSFLVNGTPASFIYANLNGTITAWNSSVGTKAQLKATTTGAVYTGLVMQSTASGDFLYAANPRQGRIDVFDGSFNRVTLPVGAFVDPDLPARLIPFNVEDVNGDLYVAYAKAGPPVARQMAPEGVGAIAVFDTSGNFIKQFASGGKLASPWGITLAPPSFGEFGGALLVGNFSYAATEINAFDPTSGAYLGTLTDGNGHTLLAGDNGLWDLTFGQGENGGVPRTLYFVAGLNAETDGLFGAITPAPRPGIAPGQAGQSTVLGIALIQGQTSPSVIATPASGGATGDVVSGAGSDQAVTPPAATIGSDPTPAPAPQSSATTDRSANQDSIDQLFAALAGSDDATWNAW
jgi:uncharacterized protein (TIGR03118 family)